MRLIPPQYVKPFVKRNKNDRNDTEAISEAAAHPTMRSVAVKTIDQQAQGMIVKHREMLAFQRTQAINTLRGDATEFRVVAAKGTANVTALLAMLAADTAIPAMGRAMFEQMRAHIEALENRIADLDRELAALHKAHPISRLLAEIPGVGPMIATTMALTVDPRDFCSGRHFAAYIGLTPREHSTGGKRRLGGITKAGNERLRMLLVVGAMSVIRRTKPGSKSGAPWLLQLLERKPHKLAAVALANKMARIIWAKLAEAPVIRRIGGVPAEGMMARGEAYGRQPAAA